jgi:hypothetical protein
MTKQKLKSKNKATKTTKRATASSTTAAGQQQPVYAASKTTNIYTEINKRAKRVKADPTNPKRRV